MRKWSKICVTTSFRDFLWRILDHSILFSVGKLSVFTILTHAFSDIDWPDDKDFNLKLDSVISYNSIDSLCFRRLVFLNSCILYIYELLSNERLSFFSKHLVIKKSASYWIQKALKFYIFLNKWVWGFYVLPGHPMINLNQSNNSIFINYCFSRDKGKTSDIVQTTIQVLPEPPTIPGLPFEPTSIYTR